MPGFDWQQGTFMTEGSNPVTGFMLDYVTQDVVRDIGVIGARVPFGIGYKGAYTGLSGFWTGKGAEAAGRFLGQNVDRFGAESAARYLGQRGVLAQFFEKSIAGMGGEAFWEVAPKLGEKGATGVAEYASARAAAKIGRGVLNPWNLLTGRTQKLAAEVGWGRVGLLAGSTAMRGLMHMTMSRGAVGFNIGFSAHQGFMNSMIEKGRQEITSMTRVDMAPAFYDTSQAATMRQAAVQEIQNTQLNLRSAFGQEAAAFHR